MQDRRRLHDAFFALWRFGSTALVGWRPVGNGLEVLTVPKARLFAAQNLHPRTFIGTRLMEPGVFDAVAASLELQPLEIRLRCLIGERKGEIAPAQVESIFLPFAVTRTDRRAVFLLDIVGFGRCKPEIQAAQLTTLEFALNIAAEAVRSQSESFSVRRSTTGDGFYVWNPREGREAEVDTLVHFALFMLFHSALARSAASEGTVPGLRAALCLGSHYTYRTPAEADAPTTEHIVGDVTIRAARLVSKCRAGQILMAAAPGDADEEDLIACVQARLNSLAGLPIMGRPIEKARIYLTGAPGADGSFSHRLLRMTDKHGFEHACYNVKLNVYPQGTEPYYCGLRQQDLIRDPDGIQDSRVDMFKAEEL